MHATAIQPGSLKRTRTRNRADFSSKSTAELVAQIKAGFSFNTLRKFQQDSGLSMALIAEVLQIPPRTLARRRSTGRLDSQESERLLRIALLFEKAVALFEGDVAAARRWMTRPLRALDHELPLMYAQTEVGAREVEQVMGRLEHGIFT